MPRADPAGSDKGFIVRLVSSRAAKSGRSVLLGWAEECAMIDGVLGQVRAGASGVLLGAGEPGVGKPALLEYAVESASASGFVDRQ